AVLVEDRQIAVEPLALLRIGHDGVVLDADQVGIAVLVELLDRPLELPGGRVRPREGEVPGDVVLQDRGRARREVLLDLGELHRAPDVLEDGVRLRLENGDASFRRHGGTFSAGIFRSWSKRAAPEGAADSWNYSGSAR